MKWYFVEYFTKDKQSSVGARHAVDRENNITFGSSEREYNITKSLKRRF